MASEKKFELIYRQTIQSTRPHAHVKIMKCRKIELQTAKTQLFQKVYDGFVNIVFLISFYSH